MRFKITLFICTAIFWLSNGVKVNMQGSLILGRDIMESLTDYLKKHYVMSGRRSMTIDNQKADIISSVVQSASLCHKLNFCRKDIKSFINEYVVALETEVERIFEDLKQNNQVEEENTVKGKNNLVFKEQLKQCLKDIKKILKTADTKISEENEAFMWTDVIKKICSKFQEGAQWFVNERLEGSPGVIETIKSKLMQDIIISTVKVESKFQTRLCTEQNICSKSHECTKGFNALLTQFNNTPEEKVKNFVRTFYELLPDTNFYGKLKEVTATEFQVILNDMSYGNVVTKDVFTALHKTLETRLQSLEGKDIPKENDVELLNIILSDMDHFYTKHKPEPFYKFLDGVNEWSKFGGRLNPHVKQMMKDISNHISIQSEVLITKLTNEVRVFLELTVDPEK